ncbi:MAG: carboxypeptidase-like regulatory domain-containing protein [Terracidiphilus sp.]
MSNVRSAKAGWSFVLGLFSVILLLSCSLVLRAQSTYGALTGTVVDSTGAAEPGATVTLTNIGTASKQTQMTGDTGLYSFVNLDPGNYRLVVEKTGFKRVNRENITILVQQTARVDISLSVGQATETITVNTDVPLLQAETSSLGQVVEERNADELPLNGRNVFSLVEVAPSVVMQGQAGATATGQNPFSWGNFQIGGAFANQSAEYLDGQPLNIGYINLPILIPTQDSVGEFKVQTNNIGPEWGKVAGGVLNLSTKGGSNTFHGEAYEYIRNKVLNANDFFSNHAGLARPPWIQNQFGGNVGGRIWKDKTFFFYSYEGFRLRSSASWVSTVPTADVVSAVKAGNDVDLTNLLAANKVGPIIDPCGGELQQTANSNGLGKYGCLTDPTTGAPLGTPAPFANDTIPGARLNQTAQALMDLWPAPTNTNQLNNFTSSYSLGGNQNQNIVRVDQKINDKQNIFGRFSQWNNLNQPEDPLGTGLCLDRCTETMTSKGIAVGYNYVFTPNVIGNLDVSATRFNYLRTPKNSGFDFTTIGWNSAFNSELSSSERTPPTIGVSNESDNVMATQGQSYIVDHDTQTWISPTLTLVRGRHTIQLGYQDEITLDNYAQSNIISGYLGFDGTYTGVPGMGLADYLMGWATNPEQVGNHFFGTAVIPNLVAGKQKLLAGFANDTFHASSKLTLNLGLRYEYQSPWSERHNRQSYFDPTAVDPIASTAIGTPGGPTSEVLGAVRLVASSTRSSRYNLDENRLGVGPRIGFAYSIDPKTVVRGGYGLFWIPLDASWATNPLNDPVNSIQTEYTGNNGNPKVPTNTITTPWINFVQPPGASVDSATGLPVVALDLEGATSPTFENPDYNYGYMQQWNIDVQRTLWGGWFTDISYAANKGTHLPVYNQQVAQLGDNYLAEAATQAAGNTATTCSPTVTAPAGQACIAQPVANPFAATSAAGSALSSATTTYGQLLRPFPQFNGLQYAGAGNFSSTYNSLQATLQKRFAGGGTLLAAYTWAKLLSNTDTITSWLEPGGKGGVQDWNNLRGEKSLSSQNVPQHLIVSYVLDLPFGRNKAYLSDLPNLANKVVGGWGIDGVTTFQDGFPINISSGGNGANYYGGGLRPNVVAGCKKATSGSGAARVLSGLAGNTGWINPACYTTPAPYTFGNEPRVDSLQASGIDNWDFAAFKKTTFGPDEKMGFEFRVELFNTFNRVQFIPPANTTGTSSFGVISGQGQMNNPRLVQFAGKFVF